MSIDSASLIDGYSMVECQSMCWTGDDEVYCSLDRGHEGSHDDGNGWEW